MLTSSLSCWLNRRDTYDVAIQRFDAPVQAAGKKPVPHRRLEVQCLAAKFERLVRLDDVIVRERRRHPARRARAGRFDQSSELLDVRHEHTNQRWRWRSLPCLRFQELRLARPYLVDRAHSRSGT